MKNGIVTVGMKHSQIENMTRSNSPNEAGEVARIHLHPFIGVYSFKEGGLYSTYPAPNGPSGPDYYSATNSIIRHAVVDSRSIYLYNGNPNQTIRIFKHGIPKIYP